MILDKFNVPVLVIMFIELTRIYGLKILCIMLLLYGLNSCNSKVAQAPLKVPSPPHNLQSYAELFSWVNEQTLVLGLDSNRENWINSLEASLPTRQALSLTESVSLVRDWLYGSGLGFDSLPASHPSHLHPLGVLKKNRGGCLPVTMLALWAGERLGLQGYAVHLPGHVHVRFCLEEQCRNFEPNRGGWSYTDQEYRIKYGLTIMDSVLVMGPQGLSALWMHEMGNLYLRAAKRVGGAKQNKLAGNCADWQSGTLASLALPAAVGNWAICLHLQGESVLALHLLDSLWQAGFRDVRLVENRTALQKILGRP